MINLNNKFAKTVCSLLIITNISLLFHNISYAAPAYSYNNEKDSTSWTQEGYDFGMDYLKKAQDSFNNTNVSENGDLTFNNERLDNLLQDEDGNSFNTKDLTRDQAHPEEADKYYSNGKLPDVNDLQGIYGADEKYLEELSKDKNDAFEEDAKREQPTLQGHVYGIINDIDNLNKPNLSGDPFLDNIEDLQNNLNGNPFTDCAIDKQILETTKKQHTPEYVTCVDQKISSCQITHYPVLAILKYVNAEAIYGVCGENCVSYYLGAFPDQEDEVIVPGKCDDSIYEISTSLQLVNKEAIKSISIESVDYAGSVYAYIPAQLEGAKNKLLFAYNRQGDAILNETQMDCSSMDSLQTAYPQADLSTVLEETKNGDTFKFNFKFKGAQPYATLNVKYDPNLVARDTSWKGEESCLNQAQAITVGELEGSVTCEQDSITENGNAILAGIQIDPKYLNPQFGLNGSCSLAKVEVNTNTIQDENGNLIESDYPLCSELKKQGCGFVSAQCIKYGSNEKFSNACLAYKNTYDCGYENDIEVDKEVGTYNCPGKVACMGIDCLNIAIGDENTDDFNKALGILQESQQASNDMECSYTGEYDDNGDAVFECNLFSGERRECKYGKILSGFIEGDCCEGAPVQGDFSELVRQNLQMNKVAAVKYLTLMGDLKGDWTEVGWIEDTAGITGWEDGVANPIYSTGWDMIKNFTGIGNALDKVTGPIVDGLNNLIPFAGYVFQGVFDYAQDMIVGYVMQNYVTPIIMSAIHGAINFVSGAFGGATSVADQILGDTISETAQNMLVESGMSQASAQAVVNTVGAVVSVIGWIYAVYSAAKIVGQMIAGSVYKCEDEEIELQTQRKIKNCDYVGNYCTGENDLIGCYKRNKVYCCFTSPLSRILNKQIRFAQNGCYNLWPNSNPSCAWGSNEHANCRPITHEEMAAVDWTTIDMTEWLDLLKASDVLASEDITISNLTSKNYLPNSGIDPDGNILVPSEPEEDDKK